MHSLPCWASLRRGGVLSAIAIVAVGCRDALAPVRVATLRLSAMQVGEVQSLSFAQLGTQGLTIAAPVSGAAQYLMVIANVAGNSALPQQYSVSGAELTGRMALPGASQKDVGTSAAIARFGATGVAYGDLPAGVRLETMLRAYERQQLSLRSRQDIVGSLRRSLRLIPSQTVPTVGATLTLHTLTAAGFGGVSANLCNNYDSTMATVRVVSNHAIIATDNASPFGGFTTTELQTIGEEFDNLIYPTDTSYFGTPSDFDGNGHVIIFFTPSVNQLTPAGTATTSGYIGGFFFAGDLFPPSQCKESNQGEIFYLLTPDPRGTYGNLFTHAFVRQVTRGTVAHEFQHMINAGHRIASGAPAFEATWLDEALAHFAEDAVGRAAVGVSPTQTLSINDLVAVPDSDVQAFFLQNFVRAKYYVTGPDTVGPIVSHQRATVDLAARGAEWALLRYVTDQFAQGDVHTFTRALAAGPDTGNVNLTSHAGASLDSIVGDWLVTMYTDHQGIPGLPDRFNYTSYTMRDIVATVFTSVLPTGAYLPVNSITAGTTPETVSVPASSAAYFLISQDTGAVRAVTIKTAAGSVPSDPNGRIYLVRLQ